MNQPSLLALSRRYLKRACGAMGLRDRLTGALGGLQSPIVAGEPMRIPLASACCLLLLLSSRASAETYHCVSFEYPPLITRPAAGADASGFAVELVKTVFQRLGDEIDIKLYPWERAMALVKLGEADCIFTVFRSPEREQFLDFSHEMVARQVIYFYARRQSGYSFNGNFALLKGARIGVVRQINYGAKFEEARASLTTDEAASIEQNFRKLVAGRVDLVPSNLYTTMATMALPSLHEVADQIVRLSPPLEIVPSYIGFSRKRKLAALRERFDVALKKFAGTDEHRRLLEKYKLEGTLDVNRLLDGDGLR
jgi:polar amino acid transport system substrate-binding protein